MERRRTLSKSTEIQYKFSSMEQPTCTELKKKHRKKLPKKMCSSLLMIHF